MVEVIEDPVEGHGTVLAPRHGVLLEEAQALVHVALLATVDERHAEGRATQDGHGPHPVTVAFPSGAVPRILVVVGHEGHAVGRGREPLGLAAEIVPHVTGVHLPLGHLIGDVVEFPSIAGVKGADVMLRHLGLGQHEDVGLDVLQSPAGPIPECGRHLLGHVAPESVNVVVADPEGHGVLHRVVEAVGFAVVPIELGHVDPIRARRGLQAAEGIEEVVPHADGIGGPHGIEGGVVGDPIDDDLHFVVVRGRDEGVEILPGAIVRIEGLVILHTVGTAERGASRLDEVVVLVLPAFPVDFANGVHRHEPDDVDAQLVEAGQVGPSTAEGAIRGVLADVHFVDHGVAGPLGVDQLIGAAGGVSASVARSQQQAGQKDR